MIRPPSGILPRLGGALLLAGAAVVIFLSGRRDASPPGPPPGVPASRVIERLDSGIDSVLSRFGVGAEAVRKRSVGVPGEAFTRTERIAALPDTVVPLSVNAALNSLARAHHARAVASEDLKLHTVTIHIELDGTVVHTVILKRVPAAAPRGRPRRIAT